MAAHDTIDQAFVTAWDQALMHKAQQTVSRLMATITDKGTIEGESFTHNTVGTTEMDEKVGRLGDTVWSDIEHGTAIADMKDYFKAVPLDRADIPKMKINPVAGGDYMQILLSARNRLVDRVIFDALLNPQRYKDGSVISLPNTQKVLNSGVGLTKAKIIQVKSIFRGNELDEHNGEDLYFLYNSDMLQQILGDTTLTSADFMSVKMLQEGDVSKKWLGFSWVPYNNLRFAGNIATTAAYCRSAAKIGRGYEEGDVARRPDKQNAWQVSMAASYGALRTEEKRVVSVDFLV